MKIAITHQKNGTIRIKVGRTTHLLQTSGEADAFLAGFKIAHIELANKITPLLKIGKPE